MSCSKIEYPKKGSKLKYDNGNNAKTEHPFPQFERKNWRSLNGTWDFAFDMNRSGLERAFAQRTEFEEKILVPFCPESDLSGIGYKDFIPAVWYHRTLRSQSRSWKVRFICILERWTMTAGFLSTERGWSAPGWLCLLCL